jgi:predicted solute-binding protein
VNEFTTGYGERGRRAIDELFRRAGTTIEATYA